MEKILLPVGTKQDFSQVFSDLQSFIKTNLKNRLDQIVDTYGIQLEETNGSITSNDFEASYNSGNESLEIQPGSALTPDLEYIYKSSISTVSLSSKDTGSYKLIADYDPYTDEPATVLDGFMYDSEGETSEDTRQHDSTTLKVISSGTALESDQIYIADIDWIAHNGSCTVTDKRDQNILKFKDEVISDSNILKKDRFWTVQLPDDSSHSEIQNAFSENIISFYDTKMVISKNTGFGGKTSPEYPVDVSGNIKTDSSVLTQIVQSYSGDLNIKTDGSGGDLILELADATGQMKLKDSSGTELARMEESQFRFLDDLYVEGSVNFTEPSTVVMSGMNNPTLKLGVGNPDYNGGDGIEVLTESTSPTDPVNFRIYDINPSEQENSHLCNLHIKWNYDDINGTAEGNHQFAITTPTVDEVEADLTGKYLYFTGTGSKYEITAWNNSTKILTLEDIYVDETPNYPSDPARIIDDATGYKLAVTTSTENPPTGAFLETNYYTLDEDQVNRCGKLLKNVDLDQYYWFSVTSKRYEKEGTTVLMPAGTYDPDHSAGGQSEVSYSQPAFVELPDLVDDGTISLTKTDTGFNIDVGGWSDAHEFEFVWASTDYIDWSGYKGNNSTNSVVSDNRHQEITTSYSRKWRVGVRPLQNKSVVMTPGTVGEDIDVYKEAYIVSGAPGISSSDNMLFNATGVDIRTFSGDIGSDPALGLNVVLQNIVTPSGGSLNEDDRDKLVTSSCAAYLSRHTSVLKDGQDQEFLIDPNRVFQYTDTSVLVGLKNFGGNSYTASDLDFNGTFTINTTERGRRVKIIKNISQPLKAVTGQFDSDIIEGATKADPAVIRVCQNTTSGKSLADYKEVYENDAAYTIDTDFELDFSNGELSVLLDCWDPVESEANNTANVKGRFSLWMRPIKERK